VPLPAVIAQVPIKIKKAQQPGMKIITRAISPIEFKLKRGIKFSNTMGFQAAKRAEMI